MLQVLTTDEFGDWFEALGDEAAEEVAVALEVVERLGPERAAPGTGEWLLWYEHPAFAGFELALHVHEWGPLRDYAKRVIEQLESPRFVQRLSRLSPKEAGAVFEAVEQLKRASSMRWPLRGAPGGVGGAPQGRLGPEGGCDEVRKWYFAALSAAGLEAVDLPAHSPALREYPLRAIEPGLRLLYGVDAGREAALFVLGERLDRSYYGDSVRRAERAWRQFLAGELRAPRPARVR